MKKTYKMFKRVTSFFVSMTLLLSFTLSSVAEEEHLHMENLNLKILSDEISEETIDFAKNTFSQFDAREMTYVGYSYEQIVNMRLSHGFTVTQEDTLDYEVYYFPVLHNNDFVGMLLIIYKNGEYTYQYQTNSFIDNVNVINNNGIPIEIYAYNNAYFYIDQNDEIIILEYSDDKENDSKFNKEERVRITDKLFDFNEQSYNFKNFKQDYNITEQKIDIDFSIIKEIKTQRSNKVIVDINNNSTYDNSINYNKISLFSEIGKVRDVPIVDNYNGDTCWASCVGSIIAYWLNCPEEASLFRMWVLNDKVLYGDGLHGASIEYVHDQMEFETGATLQKKGMLTLSEMQNQILTWNDPAYTSWKSSDSGHGMVLRGYTYESTLPNDTSKYKVYLMDPNKGGRYIIIQYGEPYVNVKSYTWTYSIYGSYD